MKISLSQNAFLVLDKNNILLIKLITNIFLIDYDLKNTINIIYIIYIDQNIVKVDNYQ